MISLISSKFDFDITVFTVEYKQTGRTLVSGDAILDSQTLVADLFTTLKCTLHRHDRGTWLPQSSYSTMEHLFEQRCIIQWHQSFFSWFYSIFGEGWMWKRFHLITPCHSLSVRYVVHPNAYPSIGESGCYTPLPLKKYISWQNLTHSQTCRQIYRKK